MCKKFLQISAVMGIISSGIIFLAVPKVEAANLCICTGAYLNNPAATAATCSAGACAAACGATALQNPQVAHTINCPTSCGDMQGKLCY